MSSTTGAAVFRTALGRPEECSADRDVGQQASTVVLELRASIHHNGLFLACSLTCAAGHVKFEALYICTQRLMNRRNAVPRESTKRWSHEKERSRVTKGGANGRRGTVTSLWVQWNG